MSHRLSRSAPAFLLLTLATVGAGAGAGAVPGPVQAVAAQRPHQISIGVTRPQVPAGDRVAVRGIVRPRTSGSVRLQERRDGAWQVIGRDRITRARTYRIAVSVPEGAHRVRAVVATPTEGVLARSRVLTLTGLQTPSGGPLEPPPPTSDLSGAGPLPALTPALLDTYRSQLVAQINAYRQSHGKPALLPSPAGDEAAQARARAVYEGREQLGDSFGALGHLTVPIQGRSAICEGFDHSPDDGPDDHENPSYLIDATSVAVGYHYDHHRPASAQKPVWNVYVFTPRA